VCLPKKKPEKGGEKTVGPKGLGKLGGTAYHYFVRRIRE